LVGIVIDEETRGPLDAQVLSQPLERPERAFVDDFAAEKELGEGEARIGPATRAGGRAHGGWPAHSLYPRGATPPSAIGPRGDLSPQGRVLFDEGFRTAAVEGRA